MQPWTPMVVKREVCRNFAQSSKLEWLETDGTGGFAMGTVAGVNTRRYHGLLVAALQPPVGRHVLLSHIEEQIGFGDAFHALGAAQYPGAVNPAGFQYLEEFRLDPAPVWTYGVENAALEKRVFLAPGKSAVVIRYRASRDATLRARLFLAFRDYHSLTHANPAIDGSVGEHGRVLAFQPYASLPPLFVHHSGGRFLADGRWYYNCEYLEELDRGLDFREDLYSPGVLEFSLNAGETVWMVAATDPELHAEEAATQAPPRPRSVLDAAADPFRARRAGGQPTILAGFPWFTDWGRDTMISLRGLLVERGLLEEARAILEGFLAYRKQGLIPNRFSDSGAEPEYNTADATLWMFQAVNSYLQGGGDIEFLRQVFYPAAKDILDWHTRGTLYGIGVDPADGLLHAGSPGTQLTWMDAKVGDWVVTPRRGKPVEIQALWHNALRLTAGWAGQFGESETAQALQARADRVEASFRARFWNPARNCLYDFVAADGPVAKLRPNQIFAVSLAYPLLEPEQQRAVVRIIEAELLTPVGLRTLERSDPEYKGRYEGGPRERDAAYHQGTVWPWLLGPFVTAYLRAFGRTPETLDHCRAVLAGLHAELDRGCLGTLCEIYDGDEPHRPAGCPAQAWSVAEALRSF
ncbi:MAG: amylo-alpha-1,6-glucosidase [Bryobacteraceae bacterium]